MSPVNGGSNPIYFPVVCNLSGEANYAPAGSSGGWQIIERPKMVSATQWFDRPPFELSFTGILDLSIHTPAPPTSPADSVESLIAQMFKWMDAIPGTYEPPIIRLSGPIPGKEKLWAPTNVKLMGAIRDRNAGYRTQQTFEISFYEYTPPLGSTIGSYSNSTAQQWLQSQDPAAAGGTQQYVLYTIKDGDTLNSIAARMTKGTHTSVAAYIPAIQLLNNIRDPATISLMAGQVITLPPA